MTLLNPQIKLQLDYIAQINNLIAKLHNLIYEPSAADFAEEEDDEALIIKLSKFYKDKEMHHKDGNSRNYSIENLEVVDRHLDEQDHYHNMLDELEEEKCANDKKNKSLPGIEDDMLDDLPI
jgi:hypothetical protein